MDISNPGQTPLLRRALVGNAAFSALSGLLMLVGGGAIARILGPEVPALVVHAVGIGLLGFAASLVVTARRLSLRDAAIACACDWAWVAGTALLLVVFPGVLSTTGAAVAVAVAAVVALLATAQMVGIRQLRRG